MSCAKRYRNDLAVGHHAVGQRRAQRASPYLLAALVCALIVLFAGGCAPTVRPLAPQAKTASFDGGQENSGLIAIDSAHNGVLTPHARDRYNGLVSRYGGKFSPPVHQDDGITPTATNTFLINAQHLSYFARFNRWAKQQGVSN